MGMILRIASSHIVGYGDIVGKSGCFKFQIICKFSNERMCTRKKDVERLSCGFETILY